MSQPAIRAEALVRDFGPVRALDHLSMEVPSGIVFGFLGPNGAGKTTAIRTFLGLVDPTGGRAEVLGFDTRTDSHRIREQAGALLEHHGLYERLTAAQNLELAGRIWHMSAGDRRERSRELLSQFGLWERRDEPAGRWSRGMKQKLAVARAVFHRPPLVFLDEPTAGLDPVASSALRDDLARLASAQGTTIFLTTHNLIEAERLCALVGVIRRGRLVAMGPPAALGQGDTSSVVITGSGWTPDALDALATLPGVRDVTRQGGAVSATLDAEAGNAALVASLVAHGVAIDEVRRERQTLERVFLELVSEEPASGAPTGPEGRRAR